MEGERGRRQCEKQLPGIASPSWLNASLVSHARKLLKTLLQLFAKDWRLVRLLHDQVARTGRVMKRGPEFGPVARLKGSDSSSSLLCTPLKTYVLQR